MTDTASGSAAMATPVATRQLRNAGMAIPTCAVPRARASSPRAIAIATKRIMAASRPNTDRADATATTERAMV
jgi:hypothetical protein